MSDVPRKDRYLNEAIEILDAHLSRCKNDIAVAFNTLSSVYNDFINEELSKCINDKRYFLENYYVIKSKQEGFKTLYPFHDAQEIIYEEIMALRRAGKAAKCLIDKARQQGCLDPSTKVLTADLRWVEIDTLKPGDEIVAVDEGRTEIEDREAAARDRRLRKPRKRHKIIDQLDFGFKRPERKMRTAVVLDKWDTFQPAFRITLDDGRVLTASSKHRWLCLRRGGCEPIWRAVRDMQVGDEIRYITKPWGNSEYEDGWFGGFLDGEGSMPKGGSGSEANVSQSDNPAYARALDYLKSREYNYHIEQDNSPERRSKFGNKPVNRLVVSRIDEVFHLVGQTRPARFLGRRWWEGKSMPGKSTGVGWARIVSIDKLPRQRLIDIQTTTKTFIAEGMVSHNSSTLTQGMIFHETAFNEATNTLIVAQDPDQADYLFSMSVRCFENLPWWLRPQVRYHSKGRYMVFDSEIPGMRGLHSEIFVQAANKLSGVSVGKTVNAAHLSELSIWDNAEILTEQIFPALSPNAIAVLESTARGADGFWFDFWCEAEDSWGDEDWEWKPIFIEWFRCRDYSLPIQDKATFKLTEEEEKIKAKVCKDSDYELTDEQFNWRRVKRKETIKIKGDDTSFRQEYPLNAEESFQVSGLCAFPKDKLYEIINTTCCDPLWFGEIEYSHGAPQEVKPHLTATFNQPHYERTGERLYIRDRVIPPAKKYGARLRVWELPEPGESYYVAGDPAHGLEGGDFSCAQVIRIGHGPAPDEQVAEWNGWINPTPFGHILVGLAKWYNNAELSLEMQGVGERTYIEVFRILEYPNLFRWKHYDKIKNVYTDYMAWLTTIKTRDLIITNLRERIMEGTVVLRSEELLKQMLHFSAEEEGTKFSGHGTNDDRCMSMMICLWCAHDSDYGKQAAMEPRTDVGQKKFYVIDNLGRIVQQCEQKDEALAAVYAGTGSENTRPIWKPGWSIAQSPTRKDFNNTEFSPVHDRSGPRQRMYAYGVPAERIRLDNVQDFESLQEFDNWMCY
jgi:hypothetical protein